MDKETIKRAILLFTHWSRKETISKGNILPTQRLNKWRPKGNIALITSKKDLLKLTECFTECANFIILFSNENVLRVKRN